jgi:hypothetical protein
VRDLEVRRASVGGDIEATLVDGEFAPVAHQAAGATRLGVVDEREQIAARSVGAEDVGAEAGGGRSGFGLMGHLFGSPDSGVEPRCQRRNEPVGLGGDECVAQGAHRVVEVVERCLERCQGADVDHAVVHGQLVEVDEPQCGRGRLGGDRSVGEDVDADVAVLGEPGDEPGHLGERAVEVALGVGEIVGCLPEGVARFVHLAVLDELETVEQAKVAVTGSRAGLHGGGGHPGGGDGGEYADTDGAPHDPLADVLASADVARDGDDAHRCGGEQRGEEEELVPLEAQRDLDDERGDAGADDDVVGAVPADPGAAGEGGGGEDDPQQRAGQRPDDRDAGAGHQRPPGRRGAEPGDECGECRDEDRIDHRCAGGRSVGQGGGDRRDGGDDGDGSRVVVGDRVPPRASHPVDQYRPGVRAGRRRPRWWRP